MEMERKGNGMERKFYADSTLPCKVPLKGYFTVKKSKRKVSNIGIDQAHEQNNKLIKIDGGAIGLFDNEMHC